MTIVRLQSRPLTKCEAKLLSLGLLPLLSHRVNFTNIVFGDLVDMGQPRLEVLDVAGDGEEAEDLDPLALGVAVILAVLGNNPFALEEHADEVTSSHLRLLCRCEAIVADG